MRPRSKSTFATASSATLLASRARRQADAALASSPLTAVRISSKARKFWRVALRAAKGQRRRSRETQTSGHGRSDPGGLIQIRIRFAAGPMRTGTEQELLANSAGENDLQTLMVVVVGAGLGL